MEGAARAVKLLRIFDYPKWKHWISLDADYNNGKCYVKSVLGSYNHSLLKVNDLALNDSRASE